MAVRLTVIRTVTLLLMAVTTGTLAPAFDLSPGITDSDDGSNGFNHGRIPLASGWSDSAMRCAVGTGTSPTTVTSTL